MDRARFSRISHAGIRFWNPLDEATLVRVLHELPLRDGDSVLDYGCGDGELLVELAARHDLRITGIDISERAIAACRAQVRGTFLQEPFRAELFAPRTFDLVVNIGASPGFAALVSQVEPLVRSGARVLIGDGYWQRPPHADYLRFLGAQEADMASHEANLATLVAAGFEVERALVSDQAAWDRYEDRYDANMLAFLREHPDDPEAAAFEARRSAWRANYLAHGRGTMGFALYQAVKP